MCMIPVESMPSKRLPISEAVVNSTVRRGPCCSVISFASCVFSLV